MRKYKSGWVTKKIHGKFSNFELSTEENWLLENTCVNNSKSSLIVEYECFSRLSKEDRDVKRQKKYRVINLKLRETVQEFTVPLMWLSETCFYLHIFHTPTAMRIFFSQALFFPVERATRFSFRDADDHFLSCSHSFAFMFRRLTSSQYLIIFRNIIRDLWICSWFAVMM